MLFFFDAILLATESVIAKGIYRVNTFLPFFILARIRGQVFNLH
jgi:hypothetical protein